MPMIFPKKYVAPISDLKINVNNLNLGATYLVVWRSLSKTWSSRTGQVLTFHQDLNKYSINQKTQLCGLTLVDETLWFKFRITKLCHLLVLLVCDIPILIWDFRLDTVLIYAVRRRNNSLRSWLILGNRLNKLIYASFALSIYILFIFLWLVNSKFVAHIQRFHIATSIERVWRIRRIFRGTWVFRFESFGRWILNVVILRRSWWRVRRINVSNCSNVEPLWALFLIHLNFLIFSDDWSRSNLSHQHSRLYLFGLHAFGSNSS